MTSGHHGPISGVAVHGSFVATAGYDNRVVLWREGVAIAEGSHDHLANQCAFSPDGALLASAGSDYACRIWHVPSMELAATICDHEDDVEMVAFSPCGKFLATASRDHTARTFDLTGNALVVFEGHESDVLSILWSRDGASVTTSSDDGTVRIWNAYTGRCTQVIDLDGCETDTIAATEAGIIVAGNDRGELAVIVGEDVTRIPAHDAGIKRIVYDARRRLFVSSSYDRRLKVWRMDDEQRLIISGSTLAPASVWLRSCAVRDDSTLVFSTFGGGYATYDFARDEWDDTRYAPTPGCNAILSVGGGWITVGDAGEVRSSDGLLVGSVGSLCNFICEAHDTLLTGGHLGQVLNARTGEVYYQHHSPLNCAAVFDDQGTTSVIVGSYTGEALVFRIDSVGAAVYVKQFKFFENAIKGIAVDGGVVFSACATGEVSFHDCSTGMEIGSKATRRHDKIANGVAPLGSGAFVSVSRDRTLRVWRAGEEVIYQTPHEHSIKSVAASPDGNRIATGSYSGEIAIFDRSREIWETNRRPTTAGISSLAYSIDKKAFLAASYDGSVYTI